MNKCRLEGPLLKAAWGVLYVALLLFGTVGLVVPTTANAAAQLIGFTVGQGQAVAPLSATPIVASLPSRDTVSDKVGATVAQFRVDEGGSATYSIPIQVSPGTAGMVPKLALNYSSRTATGVMGPGWSLGGLSQIARCRQTRENGDFMTSTTPGDGNPAPVNFTTSDRFCLDGVRLLVLGGGNYGDVATTYSPENDPTTLVTANVTTVAAGPSTFTVKRKDGTTSTYGAITTTSPNAGLTATLPSGTSVNVNWNLARAQDSVGNYIDYLYNARPGAAAFSFASGAIETTLDKINYTGHATGTISGTYASVVFDYIPLDVTQVRLGYQAGLAFVQTQQLHGITVSDSTQSPSTLRYYRLNYTPSASGSQFQQLTSLRECRDSGMTVCYPATQFTWSAANFSFVDDTNLQSQNSPTFDKLAGYKIADVDGDGRQDVVFAVNDGKCGANISSIYVGFLDRTATQQMTILTTGQSNTPACATIDLTNNDKAWYLIDYNGDGRADLMIGGATNSSWKLFLSAGRPSTPGIPVFGTCDQLNDTSCSAHPLTTPINVPVGVAFAGGVLTDINGDGLPDFIYPLTASGAGARMMVRQVDGSFAFSDPYVIAFDYTDTYCTTLPTIRCNFNFFNSNPYHRSISGTDINGDGRGDLMLIVDRIYQINALQAPPSQPIYDPSLGQPGQVNPNDVGAHQLTWYQFVANGVTTPTGGGMSTVHLKQYWRDPGTPFIGVGQMVVVDLNGDGLTDLLYQDPATPTNYWVMINTGNGYKSPISVPGISNGTMLQIADVNGDGKPDIVFPVGDASNPANTLNYSYVSLVPSTSATGGWAFTSVLAVPGGGLHTKSMWNSMLGDFDGDGVPDFLSFLPGTTTPNLYTSRVASGMRYQPRDVITDFTNGLSATTHVDYQPLTNKGVYQRGNQDGITIALKGDKDYGWGSPVFDVLAPLYVVSQARSSAPTMGNSGAQSNVAYRYAGALMQAGGRGFLGFYETWSFDPNDAAATGNQYVVTANSYLQRYPFVGMPYTTFKVVISSTASLRGSTELDTCATAPETPSYTCFAQTGTALWPDLLASGKIVQFGGTNPACNGAGCATVDTSVCTTAQTQSKALSLKRPSLLDMSSATSGIFTPVATAGPVFSYAYGTSDLQTDLLTSTTAIIAQSISFFCYDGTSPAPGYGNMLNSRTVTEDGNNAIVAQKLVANQYSQDDTTPANWYLGRLTHNDTQFLRPNTPTIERISDFTYDIGAGTNQTGLMLSERIQQAGTADQDLRTVYTLDGWGNRTGSYQCSADLTTDTACKSTTGFVQQQSGTQVHRYAKTTYDSKGRYSTGSSLPFYSATGSHLNEHVATTVSARDEFGNATTQSSANGLIQTTEAGTLGRPYFVADNAGKAGTTTYRRCGTGTGFVSCSTDTMFVFRAQTVSAGAPTTWTYFDVLGRPVLKVAQSFDSNPAGQKFSATCSYVDAHNRPVMQTEPFFLPTTVATVLAADGSPDFTSGTKTPCSVANYATSTQYDVLGRALKISQPDGGVVNKTYNKLVNTTSKPGSPAVKWTEIKNALGEVIESDDPTGTGDATVGLIVKTTYDASGNVLTITRDALHNGASSSSTQIVSRFVYDALGRKSQQTDPDSGTTFFW